MKSHLKLMSILAVIAYAFVGADSTRAQLQWVVVNSVPTSHNLRSVTYGASQYVAVGDTGTILTSPDGIAWTSRSLGSRPITSPSFSSITYGNGRYVIVGGMDTACYIGHISYTPPDTTWICQPSDYTLASSDGINWSGQLYTPYLPDRWTFVAYANGQYRIVCNSTILNFVSADGLYWTEVSSGGENAFVHCFTYQNGSYVFVGTSIFGSGYIFDSSTFSTGYGIPNRTSGTSRNLNYIIYANGQYVVVGDSGTVLTSPNDTTWTTQVSVTSNNLSSVTYGNGQFVAVGSTGTILNSQDGTNWTLDSSGTSNNLNSVATDNSGRFVAVGNNGTILTSPTTAVKPVQKSSLFASVLNVQARNSLLTISLPSAMLGKAVDLAVYSVSGQEIMRKRVNSSAERFTVPVSFSYGSYILVANDGSRKANVRFVAVR